MAYSCVGVVIQICCFLLLLWLEVQLATATAIWAPSKISLSPVSAFLLLGLWAALQKKETLDGNIEGRPSTATPFVGSIFHPRYAS